ncbi:MAG TPA: deoxyuridine 5'-triphosphate nucleotidohydrolase [Candidatus Latescibacteria bacterium]|nr:deoxyuridine 5'-triphosphate nucleotidohydrolase [Candidatus Latescibacterota bacterium]
MGSVLTKSRLEKLLEIRPPLIESMPSPDLQIQENGIELTVREVRKWIGPGAISLENSERKLAGTERLEFDEYGWIEIGPGSYKIVYNEIVSLPKDIIALGRPRSSLLRSGATIASAVWDAGYSGRGEGLLIVFNPNGMRLQKDARVLQLLFFQLTEEVEKGYQGLYQGRV